MTIFVTFSPIPLYMGSSQKTERWVKEPMPIDSVAEWQTKKG